MDPVSAESNRPPDPPDLQGFHHRASRETPTQAPNGLAGRLTKVGFPTFDGTDLRDWICQCEQFFDLDSTSPELRVRLAAMHLRGRALQWHRNFMTERFGIVPSWTDYVIAISGRFSALFDDPLADLVALHQGSDSIITFLDKFENIRTRLTLPETHALSFFLTNMNPHLSLHVRQFSVTTVSDAARIASLHESSLAQTPHKYQRAPFNHFPTQKPTTNLPYKTPTTTTPLLPTTQNKPSFIPRNNNDKPARKFSYQEMQDRRSKGLCMFCDEAFTPGHQLKHKRSQIFVMEGDEDEA
uniref:Ty3 transposon capsid-like protein domain-containing protein n=2 Tax=Brassica oleracea TaxID=3712 RepID=A0A0D2ZVK4_BRAOL|nr:unnamed protein product [Brassica oleracea]